MGTAENWPDGKGGLRQGIWAARYDIENFRLLGEPVALWGGALADAASPEAPHLYHVGDWYYLLIAEGGTEYYHAATVARSRSVFGPYDGCRGNPVLTQRHLGRRAAIQNAGHADLVELPDGSWYAVFLASRVVGGVSKSLGRESYIVPVRWEDGWPLFMPDSGRVERDYPFPDCLRWEEQEKAPVRERFEGGVLGLDWSFWGVPYERFWTTGEQGLAVRCLPQALADPLRPMSMTAEKSRTAFAPFVARRRRQPRCRFACRLAFEPQGRESAGLAVVQAMNHQIHFQLARENGRNVLQLLLFTADYALPPYIPGFTAETKRTLLAETPWDGGELVLQAELRENDYVFSYGADETSLNELARADGAAINPEKVGCMVGEMLGVFASGNGAESENSAVFRWTEYEDYE